MLGVLSATLGFGMVAESQVVHGGVPRDLKPLTTLQSLGGAKLPWLVAINPSANSVAIGSCQAVYIDLKDEFGKETPRNPTGMRVSMQDFDWTASGGQGTAAVGVYNGASAWSVCACQAAAPGATINVMAVYPARSLPEKARVKGLAFRSYIELPIAAARGTSNPPGCDQLKTTTVAISVPPASPPAVGSPGAVDVSPPGATAPPTQAPPTQAPPTQA
ncbi:MAG: hypothetical protein LH467_15045, partial [Gemmatimonadaceae bacterium]|nr:hypothetical protein [Gemmatimonadaceae bacterium]